MAGLVVNHLSRPIRQVMRHLVFKVRRLTLLLLYLTIIVQLQVPSNCLILFLLHRVCDDRLALGQPDGASYMFNRQGFTLLVLQQYLLLRQLILLLLFFLFVLDTDFGEWPSRAESFLLAVIRFNNFDNSFLFGQRPCRLTQI